MKPFSLIVIGHVDHGKTALVRALTGTDTDQLKEEKARGISIALGFAAMRLDNMVIHFVDAPGHERFVRKVAAGVSGANAALIVISATEGIQTQTREHIEIATLLGLEHAIIAITKSDLIPSKDHAARIAMIKSDLKDTVFAEASIYLCSANTNHGLDDLKNGLLQTYNDLPKPDISDAIYFPIDRAFHIDGHGTVVTGTVHSGVIRSDNKLSLSRGLKTVSIRGLETHGRRISAAYSGNRAALNLRGIASHEIHAGDILYSADFYRPSHYCDVCISLTQNTGISLKHMQAVRVLLATGQHIARVSLFGNRTLKQGASAYAQLRFDAPVTAYGGQRAILRSLSPAGTIGGVIILDPNASFAKARDRRRQHTLNTITDGDIDQIATALATEHGGIAKLEDIARLYRTPALDVNHGHLSSFTKIQSDLVAPTHTLRKLRQTFIENLTAFHVATPLKLGAQRDDVIPQRTNGSLIAFIEAALVNEGKLQIGQNGFALTSHNPMSSLTNRQRNQMEHMLSTLKEAGLKPPSTTALQSLVPDGEALLALLIYRGRALALKNVALKQTIVFASDTLSAAAQTLRNTYKDKVEFTTSEARATLATTRKYIVPLLEHFDVTGITIRNGNSRHIA